MTHVKRRSFFVIIYFYNGVILTHVHVLNSDHGKTLKNLKANRSTHIIKIEYYTDVV